MTYRSVVAVKMNDVDPKRGSPASRPASPHIHFKGSTNSFRGIGLTETSELKRPRERRATPVLRLRHLHKLAKAVIVRPGRLVSHSHAAAADGFTRPPFAQPVGIHEMGDSFSVQPPASQLLLQQVLQRDIVEHGIRQQPLQPRVLILQRLQLLDI